MYHDIIGFSSVVLSNAYCSLRGCVKLTPVTRRRQEALLTQNPLGLCITENMPFSPLQLSAHAEHGPVLLDGVFGVLSFSPDGRYLMYAAEQRADGKGTRNALLGTHYQKGLC